MTSPHSPDVIAASLALAKIRDPNITSKAVLRAVGQKLIADYGADSVLKMVHYVREAEIGKYMNAIWSERGKRPGTGLTYSQARSAGMEAAAKASPWLFAAEAVSIFPDVPPGPPNLKPAAFVDQTPAITDAGKLSPIDAGNGTMKSRLLEAESDEQIMKRAREIVDAEGLTGTAKHKRVSDTFKAIRTAQRNRIAAVEHAAKSGASDDEIRTALRDADTQRAAVDERWIMASIQVARRARGRK